MTILCFLLRHRNSPPGMSKVVSSRTSTVQIRRLEHTLVQILVYVQTYTKTTNHLSDLNPYKCKKNTGDR